MSGDREHNMVRFENGEPKAVWYSQHEYGEAYSYDAAPKAGMRPLSYSARGSHANYVKAGSHDLHEQGMFPLPSSFCPLNNQFTPLFLSNVNCETKTQQYQPSPHT